MDELLKDFLVETAENIVAVESQLVQFERDPSDARIIGSIFRLVHTIKGTCGFIGLPRLEKVAHSAEALIGKLREGAPATPGMVTLILSAIDRIQFILTTLESTGQEPEGDDAPLIASIEAEARGESSEESAPQAPIDFTPIPASAPQPVPQPAAAAPPLRRQRRKPHKSLSRPPRSRTQTNISIAKPRPSGSRSERLNAS